MYVCWLFFHVRKIIDTRTYVNSYTVGPGFNCECQMTGNCEGFFRTKFLQSQSALLGYNCNCAHAQKLRRRKELKIQHTIKCWNASKLLLWYTFLHVLACINIHVVFSFFPCVSSRQLVATHDKTQTDILGKSNSVSVWTNDSVMCVYCVLPGKRPWALAVQRRKSGGGRLRELPGAYQGTFMR